MRCESTYSLAVIYDRHPLPPDHSQLAICVSCPTGGLHLKRDAIAVLEGNVDATDNHATSMLSMPFTLCLCYQEAGALCARPSWSFLRQATPVKATECSAGQWARSHKCLALMLCDHEQISQEYLHSRNTPWVQCRILLMKASPGYEYRETLRKPAVFETSTLSCVGSYMLYRSRRTPHVDDALTLEYFRAYG